MDFSTPKLDINDLTGNKIVNSDQYVYNNIKSGNTKEQLKKAASEFESVFITKMLTMMDKTVERDASIFGEKNPYEDTFKSIVFQQMGRDIASNPRTSFGFAEQIYRQMEKFVPEREEHS